MSFLELFFPSLALLLSIISIGVLYTIVSNIQESEFMTIYYFIGLSFTGVLILSASRIAEALGGAGPSMLSSTLVQDLFTAYIALFLFGALWQSYETSVCVTPWGEE